MNFYSTNGNSELVSFEKAVLNGLANNGGLYLPTELPRFNDSYFQSLNSKSIQEIGFDVASKYMGEEIPADVLGSLVSEAIDFDSPLVNLNNHISILELFHGPTLAFKDFGARFMAKVMGYFVAKRNESLNILVATSGDTGSAVAYGFYDTPRINVFILYPKGKVSHIQEKQLTTLDKNIIALEIDGTFDDCQRLVKTAFTDAEISNRLKLSSANSINIARLIPQTFYYFEAYKQVIDKTLPTIFSVPSGNLGNLTAGLISKKMGLPVAKFIGASNANKVFPEFINDGSFVPRSSIQTISNAMDVGNPSNLARIQSIYSNLLGDIQNDIYSTSFDDTQTRKGIKDVYEKFNYVIDPHGSVGYLALKEYVEKNSIKDFNGIVLETAHPAKFKDVIEEVLNIEVEIPERLAACLNKEKKTVQLNSNFSELKEYLCEIKN